MCILFLALHQHPQYPVIICANRDEFHQRPTQKMHLWDDPKILAGKDLQAGGTWLGLNAKGRFSALTNFRQPAKTFTNMQSRGDLVIQGLVTNSSHMAKKLPEISKNYNGFNLVYGDLNNLHCFDSVNNRFYELTSGIHSICNGAVDELWPKMKLGQDKLSNTIKKNEQLNIDELFEIMTNNKQALPSHLPDTGVTVQWEQMLSSIFIVSPEYGTRSTIIITQNLGGKIEVHERTYNEEGGQTSKQYFNLDAIS